MLSKDEGIIERGIIVNMVYGIIVVFVFISNLVFCLVMNRNWKNFKILYDLLIYSLVIVDMFMGE